MNVPFIVPNITIMCITDIYSWHLCIRKQVNDTYHTVSIFQARRFSQCIHPQFHVLLAVGLDENFGAGNNGWIRCGMRRYYRWWRYIRGRWWCRTANGRCRWCSGQWGRCKFKHMLSLCIISLCHMVWAQIDDAWWFRTLKNRDEDKKKWNI